MNDIATIMSYEQLKSELNEELSRTANSFVRIGYLLKLARDDRHILDGSGYTDVNEFASKEYGLDKTQVSRFIRINDRFSIDGNSTRLLPEYEEYGSAKLSIMLTLPDEINEELSPEMSKSDIQAVKEDYDEEQKITDLEVMMEDKDPEEPDEFLEAVVKQLNDEHEGPITFYHNSVQLAKKNNIDIELRDIKEAYIPDGDKTYNIRIAGQGRFMVSMKESGITITNMRDPSIKTPLSWEEFKKLADLDENKRTFEVTVEKPKTDKPKKVEKSKPKENKYVKEVREAHERENAQKEAENAQKDEKTPEVEKVEGEVVEGMNPPGTSGNLSNEKTDLEKEVAQNIKAALQEIEAFTATNWGYVKEKLTDAIRSINIQA